VEDAVKVHLGAVIKACQGQSTELLTKIKTTIAETAVPPE
jgi:hypothetical protein